MTSEERPAVCKALREYGHSSAKALEIAIDAERGDEHAISWVNRALAWSCNQAVNRWASA